MTTQRLNPLVVRPEFDPTAEETVLLPAPSQAPAPASMPAAPTPALEPKKGGTGRFRKQGWATVEELVGHPSGDGFPTGDFVLVPRHLASKAFESSTIRWWLELWPDHGQGKPLRLEVVGDVVLGRSELADVDLLLFDAMHHGVSRRHAMLRPSRNALYLVDLNSTNGTYCNGIPKGPGTATALSDHSVIRLGSLNMTVQFLAQTTI